MWKSRWWVGAVVTLMGLAGFAVALTSTHRFSALWQVWSALVVSLCGAAGLVAIYGLASWRNLSRTWALSWRESVLPTVMVGVGALLVLVAGELFSAEPGSGWRGDLLVVLAIVGGGFAGTAMFGVRAAVLSRPVPAGREGQSCGWPFPQLLGLLSRRFLAVFSMLYRVPAASLANARRSERTTPMAAGRGTPSDIARSCGSSGIEGVQD